MKIKYKSHEFHADIHSTRLLAYVATFSALIYLIPGCIQPFSDLQSARLAGSGRFEITPGFSTVYFSDDEESGHVQNQIGLQTAVGVTDVIDIRLRYEYVMAHYEYENYNESVDVSVLGIGPKIGILTNGMVLLAVNTPVGFAFGSGIETEETLEIHPTLLISIQPSRYLELNTSGKALIPLTRDDGDIYLAFNIGAGISEDLNKWAVRPEIGFLLNPGEEGHFYHLSIGLTVYP